MTKRMMHPTNPNMKKKGFEYIKKLEKNQAKKIQKSMQHRRDHLPYIPIITTLSSLDIYSIKKAISNCIQLSDQFYCTNREKKQTKTTKENSNRYSVSNSKSQILSVCKCYINHM